MSFEDDVPFPFVRVDKTYSDIISRAVKSGYQVLHPVESFHVVEGRRIEGGGFAVIKDDAEDRPIAPFERLNALVDPEKFARIEY
eukprot:5173625-Heterocapsa_arctica.AAC.1